MDVGTQSVGGVSDGGPEGSPNPPASQQTPQPITGDVNQLLASLEGKLSERFKSLEDRLTGLKKVQSDIDKSQSAFREQLAKLKQYKTEGMTDEQALAEMESDDAYESRWTNLEKRLDDLAGRLAGGGASANGQQQAVANVFSAIGLDLKDPRVAVALTKQYKDADAIELAAYRLQRETASPLPNSAQNASLQGGSSTVNVDDLLAGMDKAMLSGDFEAMKMIEKELKAAGAPGWT